MIVRRLFDLDHPGAVVGSQDSHFIGTLSHSCTSLSLNPLAPLSPAFGASEVLPADCGVIFMLILHELLLRQSKSMLEGILVEFFLGKCEGEVFFAMERFQVLRYSGIHRYKVM